MVESSNRNHSHCLTNRGRAIRGEHHVPLGEDGSLTDNILIGHGHLLEEGALSHHGTLTGERGLLLLDDFDVCVEVQGPISQLLQRDAFGVLGGRVIEHLGCRRVD